MIGQAQDVFAKRKFKDVYSMAAKGTIKYFELEYLTYKPALTWEFHKRYRDMIVETKTRVDSPIAPNNAAFGSFVMMSMDT